MCLKGGCPLRQEGVRDLAEFEAAEDASGLEDAVSLLEHLVNMCAVADPEGNRVEINGVVRYRLELLSVPKCERDLWTCSRRDKVSSF